MSFILSCFPESGVAQDTIATPVVAADLKAELQSEDVERRRRAAIEIRSAGETQQQELLPLLAHSLMQEKDGQVRLAVLDAVTDMGPAASAAVPALLHTLRTNYGGKRNEELHQDYRSALALAAIGGPAVDGLSELLAAEEVNVRAEAAMALGRIGSPAAAAIPKLIRLFDDEEPRVRREASRAVGQIGELAIESLLAAAEHNEVAFRVAAISAMGLLSTVDPRVPQAVLAAARDAEPSVRAEAIAASGSLQIPLDRCREILIENLQHSDESVRVAVVNVLAPRREWLTQLDAELCALLLGPDDGAAWHAAFLLQQRGLEAVPKLVRALRHEGSRIDQIAQSLALVGRSAVDPLSEASEDPEPRVRQGAALALGQIRPFSPATIERLSAGLDDPNRDVQAAFLTAVGHLGALAKPATSKVREKLTDPSPEIRLQAIGILFTAASRDRELLDDLIEMIGDEDSKVQCRAIDAIRSMGPRGRGALPAVIEKLASSDSEVRLAAATMIGSHGRAATAAVPALLSMLSDPSPELRAIGAKTLGQLGAAARPALEKLTALFDDEHVAVRVAVVGTVGSLELEPEEVRPYLAIALQDENSDVRRAAMGGIRRFGRSGTIFIPNLILLAADNGRGRSVQRSLRRYERYGPDSRSIPELMDLLAHEKESVRVLAAKFLGLAGPGASDALPALERLSQSASEDAKAEILAAIASIKGEPTVTDGEPGEEDD